MVDDIKDVRSGTNEMIEEVVKKYKMRKWKTLEIILGIIIIIM